MSRIKRKFSISLLGLLTGFILFTASFSMLLENSIFSSGFYKSAFEKLGTYDRIVKLTDTPAQELTAKFSVASATVFSTETAVYGTDRQNTSLKSLIEANVSDDMIRLNVNSLIDGLVSYFKGETGSLPDLHLTGSTALKSVNLQVLIMYAGENRVSNVFHLISLLQFTLDHIPFWALVLLPIILIYMLKKSTVEIHAWLLSSAFSYFMISLTAGLLVQLLPRIMMNSIITGVEALQPSLTGLVAIHLLYFSNVLAASILLSGTLLYAGVRTISHAGFNAGFNSGYNSGLNSSINSGYNSGFDSSFIKGFKFSYNLKSEVPELQLTNSKKLTLKGVAKSCNTLILVVILFSSFIFYTNLQSTIKEFGNRNMGQSLSLLWGNNPLFHVTDARDDLVYLLEIHMFDSSSKKPASNIGVNIGNTNKQGSGFQSYSCITDADGNAIFMLNKGNYTLTLDADNMDTGHSGSHLYSYRLEMQTPGKSVLNVLLTDKPNGMPYVADTSLQYMP